MLAIGDCGSRAPVASSFRRLTRADLCLALPVFADGDEAHFIGTLQGSTRVPDGRDIVTAVNLRMQVDDRDMSVWRRESEVLKWYVRTDDPLLKACRWMDDPNRYEPTHLEMSLDQRVWLRRGGGWSAKSGLLTTRVSI
jgi:hypothetical protein